MRRMVFHNLKALISVGTEVSDEGNVYVALAACNRKDMPTRRAASGILNRRLNSINTEKRPNQLQNVSDESPQRPYFLGRYEGDNVGKEVMGPIRDTVRSLGRRRNVNGILKQVKVALNKSCGYILMPFELNFKKKVAVSQTKKKAKVKKKANNNNLYFVPGETYISIREEDEDVYKCLESTSRDVSFRVEGVAGAKVGYEVKTAKYLFRKLPVALEDKEGNFVSSVKAELTKLESLEDVLGLDGGCSGESYTADDSLDKHCTPGTKGLMRE